MDKHTHCIHSAAKPGKFQLSVLFLQTQSMERKLISFLCAIKEISLPVLPHVISSLPCVHGSLCLLDCSVMRNDDARPDPRETSQKTTCSVMPVLSASVVGLATVRLKHPADVLLQDILWGFRLALCHLLLSCT